MYNLMIVDDEAIIRRELSSSFDWLAMGFSLVCCASSGEQALEKLQAGNMDAVLLDIRMPGMDGLTVLSRIKEDFPHIEVIILSAYDDFAYVKKGLKRGAFDYILKIDIITELKSVFVKLKERLDAREQNKLLEEDSYNQTALTDCLQGIVPRVMHWPQNMNIRIFCIHRNHLPSFSIDRCISLNGLYLFPVDETSEKGKSLTRIIIREKLLSGISCRYEDTGSHRTMILQAIRSLDFSSPGQMTFYEEYISGHKTEKYRNEINNIKRKILIGDETFSHDLENLYSLLCQNPLVLADQLKEIGHQLYFSLTELIDEDFRSDLKEDFVYQCQNIYTADKLSLHIQETINRLYRDYLLRQQYRFSGNIHRAEELIQNLYVTNLRLDEVAKAIDMSPSNFKLRFKEQTGKSFIAYLQYTRVKAAEELFVNTDLKIYEVADQVGYSDEKYFRKVFKLETGSNPREFRDSNKKS